MTTTELIKLLQDNEKGGATGKSREIRIYTRKEDELVLLMDEEDTIELLSTGDGCAGAEISLII